MELIERLRQHIDAGKSAWGTFLVELQAPGVPHILAGAGMNFVIIDGEHGIHSPDQIRQLIDASRAAKIAPFVRIPLENAGLVAQALDAGAVGVFFPQIRTLDQVHHAVELTKYPPLGYRGVHMLRPHTDFNPPTDLGTYMRRADQSLVTAIQIETTEAVDLADQIAKIEGVDMLYVGPSDLSTSFGLPGQTEDPQIQAAMKTVGAACIRHGKLAGCHVSNAEHAIALRRQGFTLFGYSAASRMLMQGVANFMKSTRVSHPVSKMASRPPVPISPTLVSKSTA